MRQLIINADAYGFTEGTTSAIEDCIAFGTVRSISVNINFPWAERLSELVRKYPFLSVGCHLNPVVGRPVLPVEKVSTLVDDDGNFFYRQFARRFMSRKIELRELRAELTAQIELIREYAPEQFSHVDFHMGLHRLPRLYSMFLDIAEASGAGRIRTHRYLLGLDNANPRLARISYLFSRPTRILKFIANRMLRFQAQRRNLKMPDYRVGLTDMDSDNSKITVDNHILLLKNLPKRGVFEFVVHPGHVDDELRRWSTYLEPRTAEYRVLTDDNFRSFLNESDIKLVGYRDIPLN